jgi:hypothetical protein
MPPSFIFSAPRSGTTWLVRALSAHPQVHATELRAFGEYVDVVHDRGAEKPRLRITLDTYVDALLNPHDWSPLGPTRARVSDDLLRDIYAAIRQHTIDRTGKSTFVDKVTPYLGTSRLVVQSIARLFPDAKIILLVRDGRDVAVSGVMHWLTKDVAQPSAQQRHRRAFLLDRSGPPLERFFSDEELTQWASHWREPLEAIRESSRSLVPLLVRYEDMSVDLGRELQRICEFLGVSTGQDAISSCVHASTFEKMSGGRRQGQDSPGAHVRKGVVGDWQAYFTAADARVFDRIAGETLRAWGYVGETDWTAAVPARLSTLLEPHASDTTAR